MCIAPFLLVNDWRDSANSPDSVTLACCAMFQTGVFKHSTNVSVYWYFLNNTFWSSSHKYNQRSHINGITDFFADIISQACIVRQWVYCIHQERHLIPPSTGWKRAFSACSYLLLVSVPSIHENAECENAEMQPPHMLWHSSQPTPPLHLPGFLHAKICFRKSLMKDSFTLPVAALRNNKKQ